MLHVTVELFDIRVEPVARVMASVGRVNGGLLGDYICRMMDGDGNDLANGHLRCYPRWSDLPEVPPPVCPMVYERGKIRFCRISDLPLEARHVFQSKRTGSTVPFVPGVEDAFFAWDVQEFLNGG
jgi:hypothetical protein